MPKKLDSSLYDKAVKWIINNPKETSIPEEAKRLFVNFDSLQREEKVTLLTILNDQLKDHKLPGIIQLSLDTLYSKISCVSDLPIQSSPNSFLSEQPEEILLEIGSYLKDKTDISALVSTERKMYSIFQPKRLLYTFLQQIAYGKQHKIKQLFQILKETLKEDDIQKALLYKGKITDYSGRTFYCSAFEYAYWAKDTHMCRMLAYHMNKETKTVILARINEIESINVTTGNPVGLQYLQNGKVYHTSHFDFEPLKQAHQQYVNGYDHWYANENWEELESALMCIGKAQRDVPAHVAQEYCRQDRSFDPLPTFNEATLPRTLAVELSNCHHDNFWFSGSTAHPDLGLNTAFIRGKTSKLVGRSWNLGGLWPGAIVAVDLTAITHLDEVRTFELEQLRRHLSQSEHSSSMPHLFNVSPS